MGDMLTRMIEEIVEGKKSASAELEMIQLGVEKLPEVQRDNTDRNRTSPFAFTGAKFEFRAVGSSASIAFPIALLNTAVAESVAEITSELRAELKNTKKLDEAALKVVRGAFKESSPVRFEGNNYSEDWVKEAAKRGLPNFRRTPESLKQLVNKESRALLTGLGVLTDAELDSRYHVRVERYVKDMLIELHTMREIVETMVIPAAFSYLGELSASAAEAKSAGITTIPQLDAANDLGKLVQQLQKKMSALVKVIDRAEGMHEDGPAQAELLTADGADAMAAVREICDRLEVTIADDVWPLPKYREMLFPV
jgi:glutamine synthetase